MKLTIVAINLPMFEATGRAGAFCFDITLTPEQEDLIKRNLTNGCTIDEIYVNITNTVKDGE